MLLCCGPRVLEPLRFSVKTGKKLDSRRGCVATSAVDNAVDLLILDVHSDARESPSQRGLFSAFDELLGLSLIVEDSADHRGLDLTISLDWFFRHTFLQLEWLTIQKLSADSVPH